MTNRQANLVALVGLLLVSCMMLARIGGYPLADPDEGRYAEIPREMIELGDWVTPHLNYVKYFEKPPLFYWLIGLSFRAFGTTEWSARLVSALAGLAVLATVYLLGRAMFGGRAALIGSGVLATTPLFFGLSQVVIIDMLLTACMTGAIAAAYGAHVSPHKLRWATAAAAATALGVLAKGPVALLLVGGIVACFLALRRDWPTMLAFFRPAPVVLFMSIVLPWFVLVSIRNPEFPQFFFIRQNLERFASARVGHPEATWYYAPVLVAGFLPWTFVACVLAIDRECRARLRTLPRDGLLLLTLWALIIVGFFTVSSAKLAPYVLPALPAIALLVGVWLDRTMESERAAPVVVARFVRLVAWTSGLLLVSAAIALLFAGSLANLLQRDLEDVLAVSLGGGFFGLALVPAAALHLRPLAIARIGALASLAVVMVGLGVGLLGAIGARTVTKTSRDLAAAILPARAPSDLIVAYRKLMPSLSFYTRGRVVQVEAYGELDFGATQSSDQEEYFWDDTQRLAVEWRSSRRVFIATNRELTDRLAAVLDPPPQVLARDGNRVVLVNFDPVAATAHAPTERSAGPPNG